MQRISILLLSVSLLASSCIQAPEFSDVPELTYVGMSTTNIVQDEIGRDSIFLQLRFTDGDGDVGIEDGFNSKNIVVRDSRFGNVYAQFSTPTIPQQGVNNGIDVDLTLLLLNDCCLYPPEDSIPACSFVARYPTNEFFFTVTIEDQAGNVSNEIQTEMVTMQCLR